MKANLMVTVDGNVAFSRKFRKVQKAEAEYTRWFVYAQRLTDRKFPQKELHNNLERTGYFRSDDSSEFTEKHYCLIQLDYLHQDR